jgi:multidrug efflux pump subunit AcrA (membrane-fusion protein)
MSMMRRVLPLVIGGASLLASTGCADYLYMKMSPSFPVQIATASMGTVVNSVSATGSMARGAAAVIPFEDSDAAMVKVGYPATVVVPDVPGLKLNAVVDEVAGHSSMIAHRTIYYVTLKLDGDVSKLRPGQFVRATVVASTVPNVLVVPTAAVHYDKGEVYVTSSDGEKILITPGAVGEDNTEVRSGLTAGQQVQVQ